MESVTAVELEGLDGRIVATGKLGHVAADRAVRLLTTDAPPAGRSGPRVAERGQAASEQISVPGRDDGNMIGQDRSATEK